ncbi:MAG TPA: hypothetical protein PLQ76_00475, partial [bacterium]|nr:hypothetical protein [bacterium]
KLMDSSEKNGAPRKKLCLNCAYRAFCQKRFSASVVNGEVRCNEYALDLTIKKDEETPEG